MTARPTNLILAAMLALAPALSAQDHAVPRGGGSGGSSGGGGSHPSPGVSSSGGGSSSGSGYSGGSSSGSGSSYTPSTAERRHPRAGTGRSSSGGGYYPGYPGYPGWGGGYYPGWGGGWYYPGYAWGSWWPYGSFGWYGGYYGYPWGGWGGAGGGGGTVYRSVERESGSLRVLVDPSEARVYVDGYFAGTVDDFDGLFQRLNLAPGRHEIALKLEGYKTHRVKVYVTPEATTKLHYELEKGQGETFEDLTKDLPAGEMPREREAVDRWSESEDRPARDEGALGGTLRLSVRPDDASIYVDGAFRGSAREASELRLAPGRHRIEIVRPGYRTVEREVEVVPDTPTDLAVELERPSV
jgi:hypothetical protein